MRSRKNQKKPNSMRSKKEIIKLRGEINEIESKKLYKRSNTKRYNDTNSQFFEKINKIDVMQARTLLKIKIRYHVSHFPWPASQSPLLQASSNAKDLTCSHEQK